MPNPNLSNMNYDPRSRSNSRNPIELLDLVYPERDTEKERYQRKINNKIQTINAKFSANVPPLLVYKDPVTIVGLRFVI